MAEAADKRLLSIVRRVRMLTDDIKALQGDRREVFAEAKAAGYDLKTLRAAIKRMDLSPAERAEADAMLETYEAALEGESGVVVQRSGAAELAVALLAEQLAGIEDPDRATKVVDHVLALLDLRTEIAVLRGHEKDRRALAQQEGFQPKQLALVVRWYEKCAKHGPELMKAGEQVFNAYRATVDEAGGAVRPEGGAPTADEKLAALFAKPAPKAPTAKQRAISDALALARIGQKGVRR